jgi:molybdopterin/thiamine biosynthesis adenylyltransferase
MDPQKIEASDLNRLVGATQHDVDHGLPKVQIVRHTILSIRPSGRVEAPRPTGRTSII